MPISRDRFGRAKPGPVSVLLDLLRPNSHIAYTLDELRDMLSARDVDMTKTELSNMLSSMMYGGRIISRTVNGETYYKYHKVLGFLPMKRIR